MPERKSYDENLWGKPTERLRTNNNDQIEIGALRCPDCGKPMAWKTQTVLGNKSGYWYCYKCGFQAFRSRLGDPNHPNYLTQGDKYKQGAYDENLWNIERWEEDSEDQFALGDDLGNLRFKASPCPNCDPEGNYESWCELPYVSQLGGNRFDYLECCACAYERGLDEITEEDRPKAQQALEALEAAYQTDTLSDNYKESAYDENLWDDNDNWTKIRREPRPLPNAECPNCNAPAYCLEDKLLLDQYTYLCPECLTETEATTDYQTGLAQPISVTQLPNDFDVSISSLAQDPPDVKQASADSPISDTPDAVKGGRIFRSPTGAVRDRGDRNRSSLAHRRRESSESQMFHVTRASNRASIQQHGLNREMGSSMWGDDSHISPGIYLWHYFEDASDYVHTIGKPDEEMDIWMVNVDGLNLQEDPETYMASFTLDAIEPSRIELSETEIAQSWEDKYGSDRIPNRLYGHPSPHKGSFSADNDDSSEKININSAYDEDVWSVPKKKYAPPGQTRWNADRKGLDDEEFYFCPRCGYDDVIVEDDPDDFEGDRLNYCSECDYQWPENISEPIMRVGRTSDYNEDNWDSYPKQNVQGIDWEPKEVIDYVANQTGLEVAPAGKTLWMNDFELHNDEVEIRLGIANDNGALAIGSISVMPPSKGYGSSVIGAMQDWANAHNIAIVADDVVEPGFFEHMGFWSEFPEEQGQEWWFNKRSGVPEDSNEGQWKNWLASSLEANISADDDEGTLFKFGQGSADIRAYKQNGFLVLVDIEVEPKGQGIGSKIMELLRQYAIQNNLEFEVKEVVNPDFVDKFDWLEEDEGSVGEETGGPSYWMKESSAIIRPWECRVPYILNKYTFDFWVGEPGEEHNSMLAVEEDPLRATYGPASMFAQGEIMFDPDTGESSFHDPHDIEPLRPDTRAEILAEAKEKWFDFAATRKRDAGVYWKESSSLGVPENPLPWSLPSDSWLGKNKTALHSVQKGIRQAAAGQLSDVPTSDRLGSSHFRKSSVASAEPFITEWAGMEVGVRFAEVSGLNTTTQVIAAMAWRGGPIAPLGAVTIDKDQGTLELVGIDPELRRQGLASRLIQVARDYTGLPLDQASSGRSEMGIGLAESAGIGFTDSRDPVEDREAESWWGRLATDINYSNPQFYWLDNYKEGSSHKSGSDEYGTPEVVFVNKGEAGKSWLSMTAPWIYIPKISTVYSGKPGQVHADIYDDVEWDELDIQGVVDLRVPDMPRFVAHLEERGLTQADMEPVRQALSQWSGKDIRWDWPGYDATFEEMYRQAFPKLGSSPDLSHYPDQGDVDPKDWEKRYASLTGDWHGRVGKTQKKAMPLSPDSPGLPTHFYHVAPAEHHDQIMQQGLLPGSDSNSPWTTERSGWDWDHQQPGGVYLWDDLDHARMYAHVLAGKNHELPDSSDGWMEQYPEWYTDPDDPYWEEEGMEPPEAEQPPAWNIYRVPAEAVRDLRMDPEAWNRPGDGATTYDEAMAQVEEGMDFDEGIYEHDTTEGHRYYTPHPISSNVLEFVEARDLKDMAMYDFENSDWSEGSYNARVPEPLTRVPDLTESPLADPNWTWDKHRNSRLGASRNVGEIIAEKVGGRWNSYLESVEWPDGQKVYIDIQDNWGTLELMNIRAEPEGTGAGAEVLKAIQSLEMPIRANEVTNPGFFEHHGFQPDEDYDEELWGNDEPDQWWFPKEANAWGDEGEEKFDWSNPPLPNGDCPKCGEPAYVWGEAQMALCGSCGNYSILHDDKWSHVPNFGDFDSMMKRYLASKTAGRLHHWQNRHTASDLFSILKKWQGDPQIAMAQSSPAEQQALLEAVHSNNPGPGPFYRGQRTSFPEPTDSEIRGWTRNWIQALNRCSGTITTADGEVIHDTRLQVELGPGENLTTVIYAADGAERGLDLSATLAEDYLFSNEEEVILPGDSLLGYQKFDVLIAEGGTEGRIVTVEEVTNAVANALRGRTAKTAAPAPDDWQEQVTRRYYNQAQPEPPQYGYHGTTKARAERILKEGLKPWDSPDVDQVHGNPFEYEYYEPRPGHVYLALDPKIAIDATHDIDDDREGGATVLRIDLSKLDPQKINPDEDGHPQAGNYEEWEEADYDKWPTLGIWAEDTGFGNDPYETVDQLNGYNSLAYRGVIPPEAISEAGGVEGGMWPDRSSDGLRTAMANMNNYRLSAYDDSLWENSKPKPKGQDGQVIITDNMYEDWSEGDKDGLPRFFHCPECGSTGIWHDSDENSGECLDCKAQWGLDEAPDSLIHEGNR